MICFNDMLPFGNFLNDTLKIEKNFSLTHKFEQTTGCLMYNATCSYTGEIAPKIQFALTADGQDTPFYESHLYRIGKKSEFTRQLWRVPPIFLRNMKLTVNIQIPEGTVLYMKDFITTNDVGSKDWVCGIRHNAHLGFYGLCPNNTLPAFELAAECHFQTCIVVPKVTLDGVLVCIHDDTINKTARDSEGNPPTDQIYVWDKTYEELSNWEYGSYKNEIFKGAKMPLLSEFFDLCVRTGMKPMFSTHPGLTAEQWNEVRDMLEKRGLLKSFHIKSFGIDILETAYSVFGTEIDGYTYDVGKWDDSKIDLMKNLNINTDLCRVGIEYKFGEYTQEIATKIKDAGFFASAWAIGQRDYDEYERLISWGVNEFTEDFHCSMGLNY